LDGISGLEKGVYGTDMTSFNTISGIGYTGTWEAHSGPQDGAVGNNIYVNVATKDGVIVQGFYCDEPVSATAQPVCYPESYKVVEGAHYDMCPADYIETNKLARLYNFVLRGYIAPETFLNRVAVPLAIFFGILSFVLFVGVLVLCGLRRQSGVKYYNDAPVAAAPPAPRPQVNLNNCVSIGRRLLTVTCVCVRARIG
jgi:hypothetical protein